MDLSVLITNSEGVELSNSLVLDLNEEEIDGAIKRIEKAITRKASYEFFTMVPGEVRKIRSKDSSNKIRSAAYMTARRYGWRFKCELLTNNFVRVTRLS